VLAGKGTLGRLEGREAEAWCWARPPVRLFLDGTDLEERAMRQLRFGRNGDLVVVRKQHALELLLRSVWQAVGECC
jgi:hypothetical protein